MISATSERRPRQAAVAPVLTLAAYTHFGAGGLRGVGMYYLVREAWRRGQLRQVIAVSKKRCRHDFDLGLVSTLPGESRVIHGLARVRNRFWHAFPARSLGEAIFDRYAASRLRRPGGVLVTTPGMLSTSRAGKRLGYTTVLYGGVPDARYFVEQIDRERHTFGLQGLEQAANRPWLMARLVGHLAVSDYIVTSSTFARDTYVRYGFAGDRIFVAPTGVDLMRFRHSPPPAGGALTYLFVGHVNGTTGILKGLQYLLRAWVELDLPDARLLVCGKIGQEGQALVQQQAHRLRNVEFTGYVGDITAHYRRAGVFVFPSLAEGMAKVTLEAMATGRPVIVTPNSGAVARDGVDGFYVPPRDVEALKRHMRYFYEHRPAVARMGANAADQAARFGWERFSLQIADLVRELSDRAGGN